MSSFVQNYKKLVVIFGWGTICGEGCGRVGGCCDSVRPETKVSGRRWNSRKVGWKERISGRGSRETAEVPAEPV